MIGRLVLAGSLFVSLSGGPRVVVESHPAPPAAPGAPLDIGGVSVVKGDTLVPVFAVRTDTVLAVGRFVDSTGGHSFVLAKSCGVSMAFAGWAIRKNGVTSAPIVRDSVTLTVTGCETTVPPVSTGASLSSVGVCFMDVRTAQQLGVRGDTTIDPSKLPPGVCTPSASAAPGILVPAFNPAARALMQHRIAERR